MKKLLISLLLLTPFIVQGAQNDPHNPFSIINPTTESIQKLYNETLTTIADNQELLDESLLHINNIRKKLDEENRDIHGQINNTPVDNTLVLVKAGKITALGYRESIVNARTLLEKAHKELSFALSLLEKKNLDKARKKKITLLINNVQNDLTSCTLLQEEANRAVTNFTDTESQIETDIKIYREYIKKTLRNITYLFIITLIVIYIYKKYNGKSTLFPLALSAP